MSTELIQDLRNQFNKRLEERTPDLNCDPHILDLERIKDDAWLKKFVEHNDMDVSAALKMLIETVVWRKENGVNDLNESKLNMEYMNEGLFYPRGKDIDNCTIFIFKSKKHTKGQRDFEELKKCVIYWMERLDKIDKCNRISIFFDMADTGLSNMDMEFTRYLINLFKFYYPDFLNYILIYEMPWVLSAAFKVIKTLLPAKAVAKMKFITKSSIQDFIPLEQAYVSWGGKDNYVYSFVPEPAVGNYVPASTDNLKKVTFSDPGSPGQETPPTNIGTEGHKISLSPDDCVLFTSDGKEMSGSFALTNCHTGFISYKIKTTSPEKFRVRPSMGVLSPGSTQPICLLLLEGYQHPAAGREKFLVMCVTVDNPDLKPKELADMWKDTSKLVMEQHKLRCTYPSKKNIKNGNVSPAVAGENVDTEQDKDIDQITKLVSGLKRNQESLDGQLKSLKTIQLFNVVLTSVMLCCMAYFMGFIGGNKVESGEYCSTP